MAVAGLWLLLAGCDRPSPPAEATTAIADGAQRGPAPAELTYAGTIRPMLEDACLACHGRWFPQAGLSMDTLDALLEGGRSGPAIVPGEPAKGGFIHPITVPEGRYRMPPVGDQLPDEQVEIVRQWIAAGAP